MATQYKHEADGSVTITMNIKPQGSMLEQEEQIASALAEVGRLATAISLKEFDTDGRAVIVDNVKHTSRGEEKKLPNAVRGSRSLVSSGHAHNMAARVIKPKSN